MPSPEHHADGSREATAPSHGASHASHGASHGVSRSAAFVWPLQLALIIVGALLALLFHLRLPSQLPSEEDYRAMAAHLSAQAQPGDVVLLSPWWTERARLYVPPTLPVVGYVGSDDDALAEHPRIWVLSQPSLPRADTASFEAAFLPGREAIAAPAQFGALRLTPYRNGRAREIPFSAPRALAQGDARAVYIEQPDGQRIPCQRSGDAWRCPGGGHLYVRTEWHDVAYEPRRCLYMHAPGGAARLVVEFPPISLGDEALLEAGYIWEHAVRREPEYSSTYVAVDDAQSGQQLVDVALPAGTEGFQRASFRTAATVSPRISIRSQIAKARQVCVDLRGFVGGVP